MSLAPLASPQLKELEGPPGGRIQSTGSGPWPFQNAGYPPKEQASKEEHVVSREVTSLSWLAQSGNAGDTSRVVRVFSMCRIRPTLLVLILYQIPGNGDN